MIKAILGKEIVVRTLNSVGLLAQISRLISEKGISILAAFGHEDGDTAVIHIVTDDNLRAVEALQKKYYRCREFTVVLSEVAHKPGLLMQATQALADAEIDIRHIYTGAPLDADRCLVVLSATDNARAVVRLNKVAVRQLEPK